MKTTKDDVAKESFKRYFKSSLMNSPGIEHIPGARGIAMLLADYCWEDVFDMIMVLKQRSYKKGYISGLRKKGEGEPSDSA